VSPAEIRELYALLQEYAEAKFGDEWWPGNASEWISAEKAARLQELTEKL
jgi:hypothetical protein